MRAASARASRATGLAGVAFGAGFFVDPEVSETDGFTGVGKQAALKANLEELSFGVPKVFLREASQIDGFDGKLFGKFLLVGELSDVRNGLGVAEHITVDRGADILRGA